MNAEYHRQYYHTKVDKARKMALQNERKDRLKAFVRDYLSTHPCVDCGEVDIIVLEFDHVTGEKDSNISDMVRGGRSLDSIKNEIGKCEVRCANCHRRATHNRRLAQSG